MIEELMTYTLRDVADLDMLMRELSATSYCNKAILNAIMADDNSHAYVIREVGHIVAAGVLCVVHTLEFTNGRIESLVVSSKHRGRGLGRMLVEHIINEAKRMNIHSIQLTSNPKRIAANNLYQKIGFMKHETNYYVLDIK